MSRRIGTVVAASVAIAVMVVAGLSLARWGLREAPAHVPATTTAQTVEPADEPPRHNYVGDPNRLIVPEPAERYAPAEEETAPEPPPPSYDVAAVQRRLTELRYYVGTPDGADGPATASAVMAFQKVNGLPPDGKVGAATLAALDAPAEPVLRGGPADRIEIDLNIQVLHLIKGGVLERTMPVSSGNGAAYTTQSGGRAYSLTPAGHFTIERRIRGVRKAPLGTLYDPMYFYRGWAIHGSSSVPPYPASHGCVRVTRTDAVWLFDRAPNGMSVSLYGGQHTFPAGSSAPGTDTPAGDVPAESTPPPTPEPAPEPAPAPASPPPPSEPIAPPRAEPSPSPSSEGPWAPVLPGDDPPSSPEPEAPDQA